MQIVTGRFHDFDAAARGASALVAEGFAHGEVSLIARTARPRFGFTLTAAALGAVIVPGGVFVTSIALSVAAIYLLTLACGWYPSRLATKVQPAEALHYE